ncbi:MAG TPA: PIN domain-containing protein [Spirochaetota bacterium]|nr:PIN domain-containing protein [Spirochaetota bacterium]HPI88777.1 PIN domain-containing protein [Spirochaetota bacterium]HPR47148.1 PIN domain-containing protein [Spirochaetota bacterium]
MKKILIYLDTSVIGGVFDSEFKEHSIRIVESIKEDKFIGVISEITIRELESAPDFVKKDFEIYEEKLEVVRVSDEIKDLAESYISENAVSEKYFEDALHIACATVYQVDVLISWNFKHIVNYNRIMQYNSVNLKNGYKSLQIFSPMEILHDEE